MSRPKLLVLAGPTASGKTDVALEISKKLPVEAVSFDSMQVYRSMPITTQVPSQKQGKKLKTHLVSFLDPSEEYNVALFRKDASALIHKIHEREKTPLLVGGTGLYMRALLDGLFESELSRSDRDKAFRKKLLREQEKNGGSYLHDKLKKVDEISAGKIHPNDHRRLVRALEVYKLTGQPMSKLKPNRKGIRDQFDCRIFFLDRNRQYLYERINKRVDWMIKAGLVNEVKKLIKKKLSQTAGMALGVREMTSYLKGQMTLEEARELLKKNTRNYAKRQLSWFRHERNVQIIPVAVGGTSKTLALQIIKQFLV